MSNITNIRNKINQHFADKKEDYIKKKRENNRRKWGRYYHTPQWQSLRQWKFLHDPCCEVCSKQGIVTPTDEIHHLTTFGSATTEEGKWRLLLNPANLCSCCSHHHDLFHRYMKDKGTNTATIDDVIQYEEYLNSFIE